MSAGKAVKRLAVTPALVTEAEAARHLGMSLSYLRERRYSGPRPGRADPPPYVRFGRAIRYRAVDLDRYIEAHLVDQQKAAHGDRRANDTEEDHEVGA